VYLIDLNQVTMNIFFGVHFTDEKNCRLHFKEKIFDRLFIASNIANEY
jgi:hypothetical protein